MPIYRRPGQGIVALPKHTGDAFLLTVMEVDLEARLIVVSQDAEPTLQGVHVGDVFTVGPGLQFCLEAVHPSDYGVPTADILFDQRAPYYYCRAEQYRGPEQERRFNEQRLSSRRR